MGDHRMGEGRNSAHFGGGGCMFALIAFMLSCLVIGSVLVAWYR